MNFLSNVPVFYINLDKHHDRRLYMENHLRENNIEKYFRVQGIVGSDVGNHTNLSSSEFGCTLSHIKALKCFLETDYEFALICEDDVDLSNIKKINFNFYTTLSIYNPKEYCLQLAVLTREENQINFLIHDRDFYDFSTAAYIVNRKYAEKIVLQYGNDNTFSSFIFRSVVDPRGGVIESRPVADELIYNSCRTRSLPIFTLKDTEPTINVSSENIRQLKESIYKHQSYWKGFKNIPIEVFKAQ